MLSGVAGFCPALDHLPNQLSGGQRQRVAIARALANCPQIVLANEPTGNLDSQSGAEVIALMRRLNRELGTTFVLVTHDPSVARQADRILVMRDGQIIDEHRVGSPYEEDLLSFRRSALGQAILKGDEGVSAVLRPEELIALQRLLQRGLG